jgi:uncharacterized protein YqeY
VALKERIADDTKAALLGGDRFVGEVLRGLKAAILNEEVAQNLREEGLDDAAVEKVIAREVKKRHESARLYRENARDDLAEPEEREAAILAEYLPEQLGDEEIRTLVKASILALGVSGPQAMGQVIGAVKKQAGNTVDGGRLAAIVKEELAK